MTKHEETAREKLTCNCGNPKNIYSPTDGKIEDRHWTGCPALYRPAVAAALAQVEAEKDEIIEKLNDGLRVLGKQTDAQIARLKAEVARLWRPMECGHPNACYSYLGPADNNPAPDEKLPKPCLACRYGDAAEAKGKREGLERARSIIHDFRPEVDLSKIANSFAFTLESLQALIDAEISND